MAVVFLLVMIGEILVFTSILDEESKSPVKDYQALIAGILAVVGAAFTVFFMKAQIEQQDNHADDIRRRKSRAARSVMPLALSAIVEYARNTADVALRLLPYARGTYTRGSASEESMHNFAVPNLPQDIIITLKECIEFADDANADRIADLLGDLQVHISRLSGHINRLPSVSRDTIERDIIDAAKIYASAGTLFNYARRETDDPPESVSLSEMQTSLRQCGIDVSAFPEIYTTVQRSYPQN